MTMAGYLTDEQMAQLDVGGGIEPEIDWIANHVYSDQEIEILRMQQLIAERQGRASDS